MSSYDKIIEGVFFNHFRKGKNRFKFTRSELQSAAGKLGLPLPKNLGDILYTYRYRSSLPSRVSATANAGFEWIIEGIGKGEYQFRLARIFNAVPNDHLVEIKILDSTPGIISRYALNDEQALLALIRYNRLIDIFTGLTCYSLQNHLRTAIGNNVQAEIDEVYVGVDKRGAHFIIPVQAKGGTDRLGSVQILQDIAVCDAKFPDASCRSIGAQFMEDRVVALFEFQIVKSEVKIATEKHYKLVTQEELSPEEIKKYIDMME